MELNFTWDALCKPYEASNYFSLENPASLKIGLSKYSHGNAWWLAEISRLIYQDDFTTNKNNNLGSFKYEDVHFINNNASSTHVALIKLNGVDKQNELKPCLVIAFRGTDDLIDWSSNTQAYQSLFDNKGKVHTGFKDVYLSIKDELFEYINDLSLPMFITGHSLGAALATLTSSDMVNNSNYDSCYTFGSPKTGDLEFVDSLPNEQIYRVINNSDVITTIPLDFAKIKYRHAGSSHLFNDKGEYIEDLDQDTILSYQKERLKSLKEYAKQEIFSRNIKNIKQNLPPFLADHAPLNYVSLLTNQLEIKRVSVD